MQIDQMFRRAAWRVRRRVRGGADNEPIVTVERPLAPPAMRKKGAAPWQTVSIVLAVLGAAAIAYATLAAR